jgi:fatty acid desaturase
MKVHPVELELARAYDEELAFERLSPEQILLIRNRGRDLYRWFKADPAIHALINISVILGILAADWLVLTQLPRLLQHSGRFAGRGTLVSAAVVIGALHSWLVYSLSIFSLHEGAAHHVIFPGMSRLSRIGDFLSGNLCRLGASEPHYYASCHMAHHARFGTEHDSEFLNFVMPRRLWLSLLPFGAFLNFSDFVIHRPLSYTLGRVISAIAGALYNGAYAYVAWRLFGPLFAVILLLIMPHVGFYADRLRQFTEHNLMPVDNLDGARSFGIGFWGLLIGGGPWGQPCHFAHHLVPSIPWYQQIILHRYMVSLFTEGQRAQFLLKPVVGYPLLLWSVVRESNKFSRRHQAGAAHA